MKRTHESSGLRPVWAAGRAATRGSRAALLREDEVRIKICAATVARADCATREANRRGCLAVMLLSRLISGFRRPRQRILGNQLAGEVEAVGAAVHEFALGEHVFGSSGFRFGAHAEFICVQESGLIADMPTGMSFE